MAAAAFLKSASALSFFAVCFITALASFSPLTLFGTFSICANTFIAPLEFIDGAKHVIAGNLFVRIRSDLTSSFLLVASGVGASMSSGKGISSSAESTAMLAGSLCSVLEMMTSVNAHDVLMCAPAFFSRLSLMVFRFFDVSSLLPMQKMMNVGLTWSM